MGLKIKVVKKVKINKSEADAFCEGLLPVGVRHQIVNQTDDLITACESMGVCPDPLLSCRECIIEHLV